MIHQMGGFCGQPTCKRCRPDCQQMVAECQECRRVYDSHDLRIDCICGQPLAKALYRTIKMSDHYNLQPSL